MTKLSEGSSLALQGSSAHSGKWPAAKQRTSRKGAPLEPGCRPRDASEAKNISMRTYSPGLAECKLCKLLQSRQPLRGTDAVPWSHAVLSCCAQGISHALDILFYAKRFVLRPQTFTQCLLGITCRLRQLSDLSDGNRSSIHSKCEAAQLLRGRKRVNRSWSCQLDAADHD